MSGFGPTTRVEVNKKGKTAMQDSNVRIWDLTELGGTEPQIFFNRPLGGIELGLG